jgi:hypothetical protein
MTRNKAYLYALLIGGLIFSGAAANAQTAPPPACAPGTLASYEALANGCSIGLDIFSFPSNALSTAGNGVVYSDTGIELDPAIGGFTFCLVQVLPGCSVVTNEFQVGANLSAIYDINYNFFIDPNPSATTADLGMDPPFGNVTINQYYCADQGLSQDGASATPFCFTASFADPPAQVLTVDNTNPPISWNTGIVPLNPPVLSFANVLMMIDLNGGANGAGFDSVTGDSFLNTSTPEPSSILLLLMGGGLLALGKKKYYS